MRKILLIFGMFFLISNFSYSTDLDSLERERLRKQHIKDGWTCVGMSLFSAGVGILQVNGMDDRRTRTVLYASGTIVLVINVASIQHFIKAKKLKQPKQK